MLDLRDLRCPLPLIRARAALPGLAAGDTLVVLATDPEAPVDLGALAADHGLTCRVKHDGDVMRISLRR